MNIEDFRTYFLSFKGVHEKMPFDKATSDYDKNLLVFCVAEKWFCLVNINIFEYCIIKCDSGQSGDLQDRYEAIRPGYHMNKKHWINVYFNQDVPDQTIKELVKRSYDLVVMSLSKKDKETLQAM